MSRRIGQKSHVVKPQQPAAEAKPEKEAAKKTTRKKTK